MFQVVTVLLVFVAEHFEDVVIGPKSQHHIDGNQYPRFVAVPKSISSESSSLSLHQLATTLRTQTFPKSVLTAKNNRLQILILAGAASRSGRKLLRSKRAAPEDDLLMLLGKLIEKMRRALAVKHLANGALGLQIGDHQIIKGQIEWDAAQEGHVPLLIIDGREITWEEFGRMLMTFEGFQFKLNICDKSEEL